MKKIVFILFLFCSLSKMAFSVTAYPELINFRQPDKTTFLHLYMKGDERIHWAETVDGYSLVVNDKGYFVYATTDEMGNMIPSKYIATEITNRSQEVVDFLEKTPKKLFFSKIQISTLLSMWKEKDKLQSKSAVTPLIGTKRVLIILMQFPDEHFQTLRAMFNSLMNEVNTTVRGASGSVHDFYYENSYGQLNLVADVVGPYTTDSNAAFYGRNDNQDVGYQTFATEAVVAASNRVNFSNYDNDGDGIVDCIHIIFAGHGEEAGAGADRIWSHKWSFATPLVYNNTRIETYSCSPELAGNMDAHMTQIGVICHEMGHVFGAPDYYDTDYSGSGGEYPATGKWDLMASGSWNLSGRKPAHHNPYTKCYVYGWTTPKIITTPQLVTLQPSSEDSASIYRINTTTSGEYYLLENRQKMHFDAGLPGHGLIVYHAHANLESSSYNINTTHPQKFYPIVASCLYQYPTSATNSYGSVSGDGCPFPGTGRKQTLNDTTTPWFRPWNGQTMNKSLTCIGENTYDNTVSFSYNGAIPEATNFYAQAVSGSKIRLFWNPFGAQKVMIVRNDTNNFSAPTQGYTYTVGDVLPAGEVVVAYNLYSNTNVNTGLSQKHTYYYKLYVMIGDSNFTYSNGITCSATTICNDAQLPYTEQFNRKEIPTCWNLAETNNLTWTVDTTIAKDGQPNLALLLQRQNSNSYTNTSMLVVKPLNLSDNNNWAMSFDVKNQSVIDTANLCNDTLIVLYKNQDQSTWQILQTYVNYARNNWKHNTILLPNTTEAYQIAFEARLSDSSLTNNYNNIFIDNVKVSTINMVSATTDGNGTINPNGLVAVVSGDDLTFDILPNYGYKTQALYLDNVLQIVDTQFVLRNITTLHNIYVTFEIDTTLGINIVSQNNSKILIYPNPAKDKIFVSLQNIEQETDIAIYDMSGRKIYQGVQTPNSVKEISLQGFVTGIYYIKFTNSEIRKTEKIVIKNK